MGHAVNATDPSAEPDRDGMATRPATPASDVEALSMATLASRSAGPLPLADSPLGRTIATTATDIWNDSCAVDELEYAISYGAVGATANPTIVTDVWKGDPGPLARSRRCPRRRAAERHRGRPGVGHRRGDVAPRGAAPAARLRGVRRPPGPALDADRSDLLPAPTTGCSSRGSASMAWPPTSSSSSRPRRSASG